MIWLIAKKDFLLNLISVRFIIGFILCLVIIPFTMIVSVDDYQNQMRIYEIERESAEHEMRNLEVYSALRPSVVKQPEVLSIFSKGITPNLGNRTKITLQEYPLFLSGNATSRDNPLLNAFLSIDFATVIAMVISLLALIFAYDTITREREDGTMKLVFTGQVSRISFITGKLAGLLLTLLPILLFCYILACLIILINPGIFITSSDWIGIFLLLLTSVVYMLVFILLGIFISTLTTHSSSSIVLSLLCWIGFLFIIPNMATYLSQSISPTPLYNNAIAPSFDDQLEYYRRYNTEIREEKMREAGITYINYWNHSSDEDGYKNLTGGSWEMTQFVKLMTMWSEPYRIEMSDKTWALQKDYLDKLIRQQQVQQYLSWFSPSELFGQATDALCRTDMYAFLKYMESVRDYRQTMIRFFVENDLFASYRYFTPQAEKDFPTLQQIEEGISAEPRWPEDRHINTDNVPRYIYQMSSSLDTFHAALGRLAALLAISLVLLVGSIAVFMKYDVR